jgi:hypothetical protein
MPTSTSGAAHYPLLVASYQGSVVNKFTTPAISTNMSLSQVKQNGTNISGHFTVGAELNGSGDFTGTVSADNKLQFTVPSDQGNLPLFFQGQIHADGSISGTYCSYQNNQCNYGGGGYGDWHVAPPPPAST